MRHATVLFTFLVALAAAGQHLPHPDHIVIVIDENKSFTDIIGPNKAPYLNSLVPAVALVIQNLVNDMHNLAGGGHDRKQEVRNGDIWLQHHLATYRSWAMTHNSLLIITWDEDSASFTMPSACPGITPPPTANR